MHKRSLFVLFVNSAVIYTRDEIQQLADSVPSWWHSIDLGQGVVTKGHKTPEILAGELDAFRLPDLRGRTVLDINTWDGFYAFEAERRGAVSVTALDLFVWSIDLGEHLRYQHGCKARGEAPLPYYEMPYFRPADLPGKRGFDIAHRLLGSKVKAVAADFMRVDPSELGTFDVVFMFGTLYHMENPVECIKRLGTVTRGLAVIETEAVEFPGYEDRPMCDFFPFDELAGDITNWWSPNQHALKGMCQAAGFRKVEIVQGPPVVSNAPIDRPYKPLRYRAVAHAWK